jgi:cell division cycle 14
MNIDDICQKMNEIYETVLDYRTEGEGSCDHKVSIRDCLLGIQMALNHLPSLKLDDFDVEDLLWMEQPQNGDLNWIVPGKLLALAGPTAQNWPITKFIEYSKKNSIGGTVRLNRAHYPAEEITKAGVEHIEMFMHDGTNPTPQNVRDFIEIVDRMNSKSLAVAVHCRAGLGRTGTMIATYLLFQYARDVQTNRNHPKDCPCLKLKANEIARAIVGFLRIMRPGSVLSGQPEFLESISKIIMKAGSANDTSIIESFALIDNSMSIEIDSLSSNEEETISFQVRLSKRLRMSSSSSDNLKNMNPPVSHAGRGHAAEKHSTVQIEKL